MGISKDFQEALDLIFSENKKKIIYNDQYEYMRTQLNNEFKTLNNKKLNLENQGLDPKTNAEILSIQKRLDENKETCRCFSNTSVKTIHKYDLIN